MKLSLPLFLCACALPLSSANNLRAFSLGGSRKKLNASCVGVIADVQYETGEGDEEYLACETENGMMYKVRAANRNFLENDFKKGGFKSGHTELIFDADAEVDEGSAEIYSRSPPGLTKIIGPRKLYAVREGDVSVLVVRVVAANDSTRFTQNALSDSVFGNGVDGNGADAVNLKSQYQECSHNKLRFQEAPNKSGSTTTIANGATTVIVTTNTSEGDGVMRNAITAKLNAEFSVSNPNQLAKHVMYCLPPNTMNGIAYAYINSWNSVYSNEWCTFVSAQMHEIGHNLNMAHSNEGGATYNDQSGMMGYSYGQSDGPRMCFNSAKSWQFGWYNSEELSITNNRAYVGTLVSILDNPSTTSEPMVIKINNGGADFFINFNRKAGFNSGTVEGGNQVMVTQAGDGSTYAESALLAKLIAGESYSLTASGEPVVVTVNSINTTGNGFATVSICFSGDCSSAAPTVAPTPVPTASPTKTPTAGPTVAPTPVPTSAPTQAPTTGPTVDPTPVPTSAPTQAPITGPTTAPTLAPTATPTVSPTAAPTLSCESITVRNTCIDRVGCEWSGGKVKTCNSTSPTTPAPTPVPAPTPTPPVGDCGSFTKRNKCINNNCSWNGFCS